MAKVSAKRRTGRLPAALTSFVGRRREVVAVKRLLSMSRMVTLTGVGGVGKTRLALRVASEVQRSFADGVWLVELADLDNPELLAQAAVDALGIVPESPDPPFQVLLDYLQDRRALVVLDNCEHLRGECAVFASRLLQEAPDVRILATSRQPLGFSGEQVLPVPTLALPEAAEGRLPVEALAQVEAVRLFTERADAASPGFGVTESNRDAVERICRHLDGIPLGIELAAVRLRALSVHQLAGRLQDRLAVLRTGLQVTPRHQTLRAMLDWSYDLCTSQERLLWMRTSVFAGGFGLEAAEGVCSGEGIDACEIIDLVAGLVDKSVVVRVENPPGVRYRLLETVRQYGADRLAESGMADDMRRRHRDYYRNLAVRARTELATPNQIPLLIQLKLEHGNLRTALDYCASQPGEAPAGLEMAANLFYHWLTGHLAEGHHRLDQALAACPEPATDRARALGVQAWLSIARGQTAHVPAMLAESRAIGEQLGDPETLAFVTLFSGLAALDQEDAQAAIPLLAKAATACRDSGNTPGLGLAYMWLCTARAYAGDVDGAIADGERGCQLSERVGAGLCHANCSGMLAVAHLLDNNIARAGQLAAESLRVGRMMNNPRLITIGLSLLAWIAAADHQPGHAATILGALRSYTHSRQARGAIGEPVSGYRHLRRYHNHCQASVRAALGDAAFTAAVETGAAFSTDEGIAYALHEQPAATAAKTTGWKSPLTRRETEIARLVAQGKTNKQIASTLVIAQRTAEGHIDNILRKLGFSSRTQIATWAYQQDHVNP